MKKREKSVKRAWKISLCVSGKCGGNLRTFGRGKSE
jgi:hypothetical protein